MAELSTRRAGAAAVVVALVLALAAATVTPVGNRTAAAAHGQAAGTLAVLSAGAAVAEAAPAPAQGTDEAGGTPSAGEVTRAQISTYNDAGNQRSVTLSDGTTSRTTTYEYDEVSGSGRLLAVVDWRGGRSTNTYFTSGSARAQSAFPGRFIYRTRGVDFVDTWTGEMIELTTRGQVASHMARPGYRGASHATYWLP